VGSWPVPRVFRWVEQKGRVETKEMHGTFNMGVGMVVATNNPDEIIRKLVDLGEQAFVIGNVTKGSGRIFLNEKEL
jgi:phosphoribosylformylglycinamidine cyclo-ligase